MREYSIQTSEDGKDLILNEWWPENLPERGWEHRTTNLTEHFKNCIREVLYENKILRSI